LEALGGITVVAVAVVVAIPDPLWPTLVQLSIRWGSHF
jgi:hypothetical protein